MMFEYEAPKITSAELHETLNRYGYAGWELVAVVHLNSHDYRLFFKRRREPGLR